MKALACLFLAGFSAAAFATDMSPVDNEQDYQDIERYEYSMDLDVSRVIHRGEIPHECGVVPVRMVYEDREGEHRTVEYLAHGHGCSGG
jgi:hypothetical protein